MPKYLYRCSSCDAESFFYHSISDIRKDCVECGAIDTLTKLPSKFSLQKINKKEKIGNVVKKSIDEFSRELDEEKEKMKNIMWEESV